MQTATLSPPSLNVKSRSSDPHKIWGGRGGGRHYILYRTMVSLAKDGELVASRRDLHMASGITSHSGLQRSIDWLVSVGLIEIVDPGSADGHLDKDGRTKGRAAHYLIRQRGSSSVSSTLTNDEVGVATPYLIVNERIQSDGGSPLPNVEVDHRMDVFGDEPHLLRLVDIALTCGAVAVLATPTALSRILGLSVSAAWEMLRRIEGRNMVRDGVIEIEDVLYFGRGWERLNRMAVRVKRELAVRREALVGRWMPRRRRIAQQLVLRRNGLFYGIDWRSTIAVRSEQQKRFERGEVPWIPADELGRFAGVA